MNKSKLIVLRGPSGSGKTTISKILFEKAANRIALIEQDHYRFIFNPAGGGSKPNSDTIHKMITNDTLIALNDGYDVILEGIMGVKSYDAVLEEIFDGHPTNNFVYYFDIGFKETVRRHAIRKATLGSNFEETDMQEWYAASHKSSRILEQVISESSSISDTVNKIIADTDL